MSSKNTRKTGVLLKDQDLIDLPRPPPLRKAVSYGAVEHEDREDILLSDESVGAATDISDLSDIADLASERFDLLTSTESLRRWMDGRSVLLPSTSEIGALDSARRRTKSVEDRTVAMPDGLRPPMATMSLNTREKMTIAMLAIANLFSMVVFSCIAPFFPEEAKLKGVSETAIGILFGIFALIIFFVSPLFGRYLTHLGSKFTFVCGLCVTGATSILFGFLNYSPPGATFIALCFVIRSAQAIGDAAFVTASFAIAASSFPTRVATVIGLLETFTGLGYTVGPPIGGLLYELGGFELPFWVLGSALVLAGFSGVYLIPKQRDAPRESVGNIFGLLRSPRTCLMAFIVFASNAGYSFLDPTLEPHLTSFDLSPVHVGFMFLLSGGIYTVAAPTWGYVIDRKDWANSVMLFGSVCSFVSLLFIGPSPIFPFEKQLWLVALTLVVLGFGLGAQLIPPFQQCLLEARKNGYPDSFETYGLVSSLFQCALSLGAFFGPTIGGIAVEHIGFGWSATGLSLLNLLCVLFLAVGAVYRRIKPRRYESITAARRVPLRATSSCLR